MEPVKFYRVKN